MKRTTYALIPTLLLTLAACSTKIVKQEQLQQVKKVAIIGLDLQQQKSVSKADLVGAFLKTNDAAEAIPRNRTEATHLDLMYANLADKVSKTTGWKVLTEAELVKSPAYQAYFKEKTEGFQNRPIINTRYDYFQPKGVLDSWAILTTKQDRLKQLASDLKVDAIVYASSKVDLNNNSALASMVGQGQFRPSANLSVYVVDARTGEKIFMSSANGPKVENGEKNTLGMADVDKLNMLAHQATGASMDMVMEDLTVKR